MKAGTKGMDSWRKRPNHSFWTDISKKIKNDDIALKTYGFGSYSYSKLAPTKYAMYEACQTISINMDSMIQMIQLYAESPNTFDHGIIETIKEFKLASVARYVFDDLNELASVYPPSLSKQEGVMHAVLEELRDVWFSSSYAPNQPGGWNCTGNLQNHSLDLQRTRLATQLHTREIAHKAEQRLLADEKAFQLRNKSSTQTAEIIDGQEAWKAFLEQHRRGQYDFKKSIARQRYANHWMRSYQTVSGS